MAEEIDFACSRWGRSSEVVECLKADISAHESGDPQFPTAGTAEAGAEFARIVDQVGLLRSGLVSVPGGVPFVGAITDPGASFVAGGKAIPLSRAVLDRQTLQAKKVASLIVVTEELLSGTDPGIEQMLVGQMLRSARRAIDAALTDPTNAGDDATPAAVTATAAAIQSGGQLSIDAENALEAYTGSLSSACWWMPSSLAVAAELTSNGLGAGSDLTVNGGMLCGIPAFASDGIAPSSNGNVLVLLDRAQIAIVDEGYSVARSGASLIEFSDSPTGDVNAPASASPKYASLFQSGAVGLLLIRRVNWYAPPGAVVIVEGCDYTPGS